MLVVAVPAVVSPGWPSYVRAPGNAAKDAQNWLTYSGNYNSNRHSLLDQITPANVKDLKLKWVYQAPVAGNWQSTPLVVDGVMYFTQRPNDVIALDPAHRARLLDLSIHAGPESHRLLRRQQPRSRHAGRHAVHGDARCPPDRDRREIGPPDLEYAGRRNEVRLLDHAGAVGRERQSDRRRGGGEYGIRGFISAYDARTGKEAWKFYTIPGPGEPGHETWQACPPNPTTFCDPEAWKHGGGSIWLTGSYDPELNLTYWGVGNPGPDWNNKQRPGDNLYTASVVALDADTGRLRWHYQFTPNDPYDYDAVQIPVLVDNWGGARVKVMAWANRNGNFYVLDRATGRFLLGKPFVKVNWMSTFDEKGRPNQTPQPPGQPTYPGNQGGTNWYSPSYSPRTGLFYLSAWEDYASIYVPGPQEYVEGKNFGGGGPRGFGRFPARPVSVAVPSTVGPKRPVTAPSSRSIRRPVSRSGSSR